MTENSVIEKLSNPVQSPALAIQLQAPPYVLRMVSLSICVMVALSLLFACFSSIDIVVSAQGRVIPSGKSKVVQPLEPGLVHAVFVRDGQRVHAGDVLVELDTTQTGADRERVQREYWEAQVDVLRCKAQLEGRARFVAPQGIAHLDKSARHLGGAIGRATFQIGCIRRRLGQASIRCRGNPKQYRATAQHLAFDSTKIPNA